jgi:hypothetical protein
MIPSRFYRGSEWVIGPLVLLLILSVSMSCTVQEVSPTVLEATVLSEQVVVEVVPSTPTQTAAIAAITATPSPTATLEPTLEPTLPIETATATAPTPASAPLTPSPTKEAASAESDPILIERTLALKLAHWADADGNGIADFWRDSGGLGTRAVSAGDSGSEDYDRVVMAYCTDFPYKGNVLFDPNYSNTFCFATDQGLAGKFKIVSQTDDGTLTIQYSIWGDALNMTPVITDIQPAGKPSADSSRPWPEGSELVDEEDTEAEPTAVGSTYRVELSDATYEEWGQPQHANGCGAPYYDGHPMQNFKVFVTLTNQASGQTIPRNWFPTFTSAERRPLNSCYWTFSDRTVQPGESTTVVWGTFVEPDDWVTGVYFTVFDQLRSFCFNEAGEVTDC